METAEGLNKNALIKEQEPAKTQPGQALSEPRDEISDSEKAALSGAKPGIKSQNSGVAAEKTDGEKAGKVEN